MGGKVSRRAPVRRIAEDEGMTFEQLEQIIGKIEKPKKNGKIEKPKKKGNIDTYYEKLEKFINKDWEL